MVKRPRLVRLLKELLTLPTAPFHEEFVAAFIRDELKKAGLKHRVDCYGNIVASYGSGRKRLAWIAHMDHPGFEISKVQRDRVEALWFGGVDARYFRGSRVVIYDRSTGHVRGKGTVVKTVRDGRGRVERMVLQVSNGVSRGDFGTWDLIPFRRRGWRISTKGADDLVGCAIILAALQELREKGRKASVLGIFTRAEEQGFIGTLGMIRSKLLPPATRIVSVETSKAIPGTRLGAGPVIRLGDRTSVFDFRMVFFMDYIAEGLAKASNRFCSQRAVMSGGTCEATPYQLEGYLSGGIAVPLENYHNQGRVRIGAEGVDIRDVERTLQMLVAMVEREEEFDDAPERVRKRLAERWRRYGRRLARD